MFRIKWVVLAKGTNGYYSTDKGVKRYKTLKAAQADANRFSKIAPEIKYEVEAE